ncbi:MAG: ferredoxin-type protein NapF [Mariprofundaceae bacterium]|nr:ferredoxin-type protein NapF [Mariprofundaceae bacterium]
MPDFDGQRRQLFNVTRKRGNPPLRPPWAVNEILFQEACTRCGDCLQHCPESILQRESPNGYPLVNFNGGECTFCKQCVDVCPTHALNLSVTPLWSAKAIINNSCLTLQGVICHTCSEQCDESAIQFTPQIGKVSQPLLNINACTGCGACVASCPTQAIEVRL